MARPLRIEFEGALYHVLARGNARQPIYLSDADRRSFIGHLGEIATQYHWRVWAHCLMSNHYHLLLETLRATLSRGMHDLNGAFAQAFNRRHERMGHLLQGRYKAVLVERDSYLTELMRYIVLNPVRAGLCRRAEDWCWSSHGAVLGRAASPPWLATRATLGLFSEREGEARRAYARFVAEGRIAEDPMKQVRHQWLLGSQGFIDEVSARLAGRTLSREIPTAQRPALSIERIAAEAPDRNAAIRAAYATGSHSMTAIAAHFELHYTTVSRIVSGRVGSTVRWTHKTRPDPTGVRAQDET